jgi:hypothetical protein
VARLNWVSDSEESERGIAIHASCYTMLAKHLTPQPDAIGSIVRNALNRSDAQTKQVDAEHVRLAETRALFEFCEKHLAVPCRYTLDCVEVNPLDEAHEQFFAYKHHMLWALCWPQSPRFRYENAIEMNVESNTEKQPKTKKGSKKRREKPQAPLLTLPPYAVQRMSTKQIDLACFTGMTDIFATIVVEHCSNFDDLVRLARVSKSFYSHVTLLWQPVCSSLLCFCASFISFVFVC